METKLLAVLSSDAAINVTELCRLLGISRQTFYKYRRRFEVEGPPGLVERSRAPLSSPSAIPTVVEKAVLELRDSLGVDNGAQAIAWHLARRNDLPMVPSSRTVHRVLVRHGRVVPQPEKRPKSSVRRFEWPRPNDAWQIDATMWALADGQRVWIMDVLDDHSRVLVTAQACGGPTGQSAWEAFASGVSQWGPPAHVMSDNGACFTTRFRHHAGAGEADFERQLRAMGIQHLLSRPSHPQTCGKLERSHRTTKTWLETQTPARTLTELQHQLDSWVNYYNYHRPHTAAGGQTPAQRWHATPPATPGNPIAGPHHSSLHKIAKNGTFRWRDWIIGIGSPLAGQTVLVMSQDLNLTIWGQTGHLRQLTIDPNTTYQPTGIRPGPRPTNVSNVQTQPSAIS